MNLTGDFWSGFITAAALILMGVIIIGTIRFNSTTIIDNPKEHQRCAVQYGKILSCFSGDEQEDGG